MDHTIVVWVRWAIILAALYLVLVGIVVVPEAVAAVLTAALSAAALVLAGALEHIQFKPDVRESALYLRRLPMKVLTDTGLVFAALWCCIVQHEQVTGEFHVVPFHGGGDDARSAARRALVIAGLSLPPNSYVVALDADAGHLIVHQLVAEGGSPGGGDKEWPL